MIQLDKFNQFILKHNDSLFENTFLGAKTRQGVYVSCNNGIALSTGLTAGEIIGKKDSDLCWHMIKEYQENDKRCIENKKELICQENNIDVYKNRQQLITVKIPIINHYNHITGVTVFSLKIDLLTIKEAAQLLNYYTDYFEEKAISLNDFLIRLTEREIECAYFVCLGMSSREIASHLSISPRSIEDHIANMKAKLSINKKSELVIYLLNSGLVDTLKLRQIANKIIAPTPLNTGKFRLVSYQKVAK